MSEIEVREATPSEAAALSALNDHVHALHVAAEPYDFRRSRRTCRLPVNHIAVDPALRMRKRMEA